MQVGFSKIIKKMGLNFRHLFEIMIGHCSRPLTPIIRILTDLCQIMALFELGKFYIIQALVYYIALGIVEHAALLTALVKT
jgi:hypothetical protein